MMTPLSRNNAKYYFSFHLVVFIFLFSGYCFLHNVGQGLHKCPAKGIERSLMWGLLFDLLFLS